MIGVGVYTHGDFALHNQPGHPECADRIRAIHRVLDARSREFRGMNAMPFAPASMTELAGVHSIRYLERLQDFCAHGGGMLDGDTYVNEYSFDVAALAAGGAQQAMRDVLHGDVKAGILLARPPGHHAFADHAEGFCLTNSTAIAAFEALNNHGLSRVLIVDWDVHHGNGTESLFYDDPRVMYFSAHQWGIYPGSGKLTDVGLGAGSGYTVNVPLPAGTADEGYLGVMDHVLEPIADRFKPEIVIVSTGYDAHWRDPLAGMGLSLMGYRKMTDVVMRIAGQHSGGKIVAVLEGGYDLDVLSIGVGDLVQQLSGSEPTGVDPFGSEPEDGATLERVGSIVDRARILHNLR